jgi:hypothetical protein
MKNHNGNFFVRGFFKKVKVQFLDEIKISEYFFMKILFCNFDKFYECACKLDNFECI